MANITIKTHWSDDKKMVALSRNDWEKILIVLERDNSVFNYDMYPAPTTAKEM